MIGHTSLTIFFILYCQILNDITGNLDAKKACTGAMKLHKKYLKKARLEMLSPAVMHA